MSKPRDLSKLFTSNTNITTDVELISTVNSASAYALSEANDYTDSELSSIDLSATIQTASAAAVTYLVDSAPGALDTLNELAAALGDDENFATTVTNSLSGKLSISSASSTYLTQQNASAAYLTQTNASATYATKAEAQNSLDRWTKIYSGSATTISGVDDNANSLLYTTNFENLYINGILVDPSNYTATSGSTIVLSEAVEANDVVEVIGINPFNVANTYTTSQIDEKLSNYTRWIKTLSASATVISGVDDNSLPLLYTIGNEEVYINGILLKKTTDYATTSASVITLTEAALAGDVIEVINFTTISLASVYTQEQSDTKYLTPTTASGLYLTQSSASNTYLTQSSASTNYLTQSSASSTYLTQSSASTTYSTKSTQGLVLLSNSSFSGAVSSQSLNNVFDATYTNYRIIIKINAFSTADVFKMRFRVSGADNTTSDYRYMGSNQLDPWTNTTYGNTFWVIHRYQRANGMHFVADIFNPFVTNYTTMLSLSAQVGQDPGVNTFGGGFIATTSFTGFTIFPDGGTMSDGTIKVYGYQE
jgi:hypothetical protein